MKKMMKKIIKNKAGVSAVIGVILMVAICVALATTVYVYVSNLQDDTAESDITILINEQLNFSDGYQLYDIDYTQLVFGLYEVDLMIVNGDEPIRYIDGLLVNTKTETIYFIELNNYFEKR